MRINGTTKAPVMNYAAETSLGVVTIRAFNMAERFFQNYLKLIDTDAKLFLYSNASLEWLILRVEALQNLTLFTAASLLIFLPKGGIAPGKLVPSTTTVQVYQLASLFLHSSNLYIFRRSCWTFPFLCSGSDSFPSVFYSMVQQPL